MATRLGQATESASQQVQEDVGASKSGTCAKSRDSWMGEKKMMYLGPAEASESGMESAGPFKKRNLCHFSDSVSNIVYKEDRKASTSKPFDKARSRVRKVLKRKPFNLSKIVSDSEISRDGDADGEQNGGGEQDK